MTLQEILFGTFIPPKVQSTRRNRTDWARCAKRYEEPKKIIKSIYAQSQIALDIIRINPGISSTELAAKLNKHISYVYKVRDTLLEQNAIVCSRGRPPRRGGPVTTLIYAKEQYAR